MVPECQPVYGRVVWMFVLMQLLISNRDGVFNVNLFYFSCSPVSGNKVPGILWSTTVVCCLGSWPAVFCGEAADLFLQQAGVEMFSRLMGQTAGGQRPSHPWDTLLPLSYAVPCVLSVLSLLFCSLLAFLHPGDNGAFQVSLRSDFWFSASRRISAKSAVVGRYSLSLEGSPPNIWKWVFNYKSRSTSQQYFRSYNWRISFHPTSSCFHLVPILFDLVSQLFVTRVLHSSHSSLLGHWELASAPDQTCSRPFSLFQLGLGKKGTSSKE